MANIDQLLSDQFMLGTKFNILGASSSDLISTSSAYISSFVSNALINRVHHRFVSSVNNASNVNIHCISIKLITANITNCNKLSKLLHLGSRIGINWLAKKSCAKNNSQNGFFKHIKFFLLKLANDFPILGKANPKSSQFDNNILSFNRLPVNCAQANKQQNLFSALHNATPARLAVQA